MFFWCSSQTCSIKWRAAPFEYLFDYIFCVYRRNLILRTEKESEFYCYCIIECILFAAHFFLSSRASSSVDSSERKKDKRYLLAAFFVTTNFIWFLSLVREARTFIEFFDSFSPSNQSCTNRVAAFVSSNWIKLYQPDPWALICEFSTSKAFLRMKSTLRSMILTRELFNLNMNKRTRRKSQRWQMFPVQKLSLNIKDA